MRSLSQRFLPLAVLLIHWDLLPWLWLRAKENEDAALLHGILVLGILGWWWSKRQPTYAHPHFQVLALLGFVVCGVFGIIETYPLIRMLAMSCTLAAALLTQLPCAERSSVALGTACILLPFSEQTASFFLGHPARLCATAIAGFFLKLSGFTVNHQGAVLLINERALFADAPCAGLMMGWTGLAIASLLALYQGLRPRRTIILLLSTMLLILLGNSFRMMILAQLDQLFPFSLESNILHNAIGIFSFIILLPALLWIAKKSTTVIQERPDASFFNFWPYVIILIAITPFIQLSPEAPCPPSAEQPNWPETWDGLKLMPISNTDLDKIFRRNFPGHMARFQDGGYTILFRQLDKPSRQLHASLQCYRANGFRVNSLPAKRDSKGTLWSEYDASKGEQKLRVKEQIQSLSSERTWPDVSAWYWDAVTGKDQGPWRAVTVAKSRQ